MSILTDACVASRYWTFHMGIAVAAYRGGYRVFGTLCLAVGLDWHTILAFAGRDRDTSMSNNITR